MCYIKYIMDATLIVSSQGQVVIPSKIRTILGIKPGSKLNLTVKSDSPVPTAVITPKPENWVRHVKGLGKGIWGKGEKYIEAQRADWDKP